MKKRYVLNCSIPWRLGLVVLLFLPAGLSAQLKFEREYRLRPAEVPQAARQFVDSCAFSHKVRWYGEESARGRSVEAKVKRAGRDYSIEFDTLGQIEDVEVEAIWEAVPLSTRSVICNYLASTFERFRIQRVQEQWTADRRGTLIELIRRGETDAAFTRKYEAIVRGRAEGETHGYELLFSAEGRLERSSRIVYRNTDNLDY